jgi:hypothetical protein
VIKSGMALYGLVGSTVTMQHIDKFFSTYALAAAAKGQGTVRT